MANQIQGPSTERMAKELRISKAAAEYVKQAMREGRVKAPLERASAAMRARGVVGPFPGDSPAFAHVDKGNINAKTLYYTGKSFQIGSVAEYLLTHVSSRTGGSWRKASPRRR